MTAPFPSARGGPAAVSETAFREAMSEIPAAVHVITTAGPAGRRGLTATAVTSLSLTPPLMLVCIHADSTTLAAIEANGVFCINALPGSDQAVAETFAGRSGLAGEARFSMGAWTQLVTGAPRLAEALVSFDCRLVEARTMATHRIVVGEVLAIGSNVHGDGLIYRNRRFGRF